MDPFFSTGGIYGCGRCAACRSLRARTWAHRIMLENYEHEGGGAFITLTYSAEKVPLGAKEVPTLEANHLRDWFKRIRKASEPVRLRQFSCGEYGDISWRPHYHVALWGRGQCRQELVRVRNGWECRCSLCSDVRATWGFGHFYIGGITEKSASYIAGYAVKKMTHRLDPRLGGRAPEFARMSLKPGIGASAMLRAGSALADYSRPVPPGAQHGGRRIRPLGKYLRRYLAEMISDGSSEKVQEVLRSQEFVYEASKRLSLLRRYSQVVDRQAKEIYKEILDIPAVPVIHCAVRKKVVI